MDHSRDWATRISHEAQLYDQNSFLTLTYDNDHLPPDLSVSKREMQLFLKRLRQEVERSFSKQVRFFGCGEYGSESLRPHYHLILFNHAFIEDRVPWRRNKRGDVLYRSALLEKLWTLGNSEIGAVTHASAGYVASYAIKQANAYTQRNQRLDGQTGEIMTVEPEFLLMSRRPGLGSGWWDKYASDCFPSDFVVLEGKKLPVPQYYLDKLQKEFKTGGPGARQALKLMADLRAKRREHALKTADNNTTYRRLTREEVKGRLADAKQREPEQ